MVWSILSFILWVYAENFVQIHQDLAELWKVEVKRACYQVWYGEGVWYGNGVIGGESILISLILWVYAENFVQIHQNLAKL